MDHDFACKLLGVDSFRPQLQKTIIEKAFRKASLESHPDRGGDSEKFHAVVTAKDLLMREIEVGKPLWPKSDCVPSSQKSGVRVGENRGWMGPKYDVPSTQSPLSPLRQMGRPLDIKNMAPEEVVELWTSRRLLCVWRCNICDAVCCRVRREKFRCVCGHQLKDHDPRNSFACTCQSHSVAHDGAVHKGSCGCPSFQFLVAHGMWQCKCRCKHDHTAHDPATRLCRRCGPGDGKDICSGWEPAWQCHCGHPCGEHSTAFVDHRVGAGHRDWVVSGVRLETARIAEKFRGRPLHEQIKLRNSVGLTEANLFSGPSDCWSQKSRHDRKSSANKRRREYVDRTGFGARVSSLSAQGAYAGDCGGGGGGDGCGLRTAPKENNEIDGAESHERTFGPDADSELPAPMERTTTSSAVAHERAVVNHAKLPDPVQETPRPRAWCTVEKPLHPPLATALEAPTKEVSQIAVANQPQEKRTVSKDPCRHKNKTKGKKRPPMPRKYSRPPVVLANRQHGQDLGFANDKNARIQSYRALVAAVTSSSDLREKGASTPAVVSSSKKEFSPISDQELGSNALSSVDEGDDACFSSSESCLLDNPPSMPPALQVDSKLCTSNLSSDKSSIGRVNQVCTPAETTRFPQVSAQVPAVKDKQRCMDENLPCQLCSFKVCTWLSDVAGCSVIEVELFTTVAGAEEVGDLALLDPSDYTELGVCLTTANRVQKALRSYLSTRESHSCS